VLRVLQVLRALVVLRALLVLRVWLVLLQEQEHRVLLVPKVLRVLAQQVLRV
jgi:hypothetical protein